MLSTPGRKAAAAGIAAFLVAGLGGVGFVTLKALTGGSTPGGTTSTSQGTSTESGTQATAGEIYLTSETVTGTPAGTTVMATSDAGVRIDAVDHPTSIKTDKGLISAPNGGTLTAFKLVDAQCENDPCKGWADSDLVVFVGTTKVSLPLGAGADQSFVVAAPADTDVKLVLARTGYQQTISLLTGEPGPQNITVLARDSLTFTVGKSSPMTGHSSIRLIQGDGTTGNTVHSTLKVDAANLSFFLEGHHPSKPGNAFLTFDYQYVYKGKTSGFVLRSPFVHFKGSDGKIYNATDFDTRPDFIESVIEIPSTLTGGEFIVSGSSQLKTKQGSSYTATYSAPPIAISFS